MNLKIKTWVLLFVFACSFALKAQEKPFTVPEVMTWKGGDGYITLNGRVVCRNPQLLSYAHDLARDLETLTGKRMKVVKRGKRKGDVVLEWVTDTVFSPEEYKVDIDDRVVLRATDTVGLLWAERTLLQLSEQYKQLPKGKIIDRPRYAVRGFMLDVGRKYIPMTYLKELVRVMSYYKMNTLQLHLNDNAFRQFFNNDWSLTPSAFRLESDFFPGLTAKDGSYTKKEFREFQIEARKIGVTVVPEIDAPAHSLAFTQYRPNLASKKYGADHLDLFKEETYTFLDSLYYEYLSGDNPVFVGPYVNIGTDEYSNADNKVVEQFRTFTDHYLAEVEKYGKRPMLWGALTHAKGHTPVRSKDVVMNCWYNGYANPIDMKAQGYKLISIPDGYLYIVPAAGYYYDYLNIEQLYNAWTPAQIGNIKFEEGDPSLLGGMFAVWNDHYGNGISVKDIHHRVFPALQTLSAKCWSADATTVPFKSFDTLRTTLSEAPGINALGRIDNTLYIDTLTQEALDKYKIEDIGFGNEVSMTIDCKEEQKGAVLTESRYGKIFLSDPKTGRIGFLRDNYLNVFSYRLPKRGKVHIKFVLLPTEVQLSVNGKLIERLSPIQYVAALTSNRYDHMYQTEKQPIVYNMRGGKKMKYMRTLFFPFMKKGNAKSGITKMCIRPYQQ